MPGIFLLVGAAVTLAITLFAPRRLMQSPRTALVAGVPLAAAIVTTIYVFGEDSYVGDGTSRRVRYNGGAHTLYAVAMGSTYWALSSWSSASCEALLAGRVLDSPYRASRASARLSQ